MFVKQLLIYFFYKDNFKLKIIEDKELSKQIS